MSSDNKSSSSLGKRLYKSYDEKTLDSAVKEVKEKKIKISSAARKYCIPVTTLRKKSHQIL